jgi:glycosyltransferase involved in cell wall biosynthesis
VTVPATSALVLAGESPLPPTSGIRQRVLHLARAVAAAQPVHLGVLGPPGPVDGEPFTVTGDGALRPRGASLRASLRRPYAAARHDAPGLARLAAQGEWGTVQAETPWLMPPAVRAGRPVVLDAHNVETDFMRSLARAESRPTHKLRWAWEAAKTERWERAASAAAAAVCVTGEHEAARFEELGARAVVVVPNGVDVRAVPFAPRPAGAHFIYVGHFGYRPNALAAAELAEEVLPALRATLPAASVALVGRDPGPEVRRLAGPHVEVTGEVPDLEPHLQGARGTIIPLRTGAGTRLKVLEAMAAGVPIVSTPFGVEGIGVRDGEHALLAGTPRELAAAAARLAADDALCRRLAEGARRLVEERFDWPAVAAPLVALHARLGARA